MTGATLAQRSVERREAETPLGMKPESLPLDRSVARIFRVEPAPSRKWVPGPLSDNSIDLSFLAQILHAYHRSPRHGNPTDPLDCLIYVMLSRKTPIEVAARVFKKLKRRYPSWVKLLRARPESLMRLLHGSGLEEMRAGDLLGMLQVIRARLGAVSLEPLRSWTDRHCLDFLTSLPGVGTKTAFCVMMYSLQRKVFPADAHCIRVLTRIGYLRLGLDHKEAQQELAHMVPPELAYSLHVNLVAHGKKVCRAVNPDCAGCVIRKLCKHQRSLSQHAWKRNTKSPTVVDLFAGAGGSSLGLEWAGFKIVAAVDEDFWACQTFRLNHPELPEERILQLDIRKDQTEKALLRLQGVRHPTLVIGGPPCQGFSMIGRWASGPNGYRRFINDPRNELYKEFIHYVRLLNPKLVVMENVPGLFSLSNGIYKKQIEEDLGKDFEVVSLLVNALKFGVPQNRIRVLFIGASRGHFGKQRARKIVTTVQETLGKQNMTKALTLREAIGDLPPLEQDDGDEVAMRNRRRGRPVGYARTMRWDWPILHGHYSRPLNVRDQLLYARLAPGETGNDAVVKHGARHLMVYRTDVFEDQYRRLVWEQPSPTILAHLSHDGHNYIHPDTTQTRSITLREAARIQSFPDDFIFYGPRTYTYRHVGNAVPPLLARAIGGALLGALR